MSTPITFSGFNNIDFGSIVTAIMSQARVPETLLKQHQQELKSQSANLSEFSTSLAALDSAATALARSTSLTGRSVSNTDSSAVSFSADSTAPLGTYDVVVQELARAQVTASTTTAPDTDTTAIAAAGTLTIGGVDVVLAGPTTIDDLAAAINDTPDIGVTATVIQSGIGPAEYKLVLTGQNTGSANGFTIAAGTTGLTFGAASVPAGDAEITVNNVTVKSATNSFASAIPGATVIAQKKGPDTVTLTVQQDSAAGKQLVENFVSAYNDVAAFVKAQQAGSAGGDKGSLGRDSILRAVSGALREALGGDSLADATLQNLASVGIGFTRTGTLSFDSAIFDEAAKNNGLDHLQSLFSGSDTGDGVFDVVHDTLGVYTGAEGLVTTSKTARTDEASAIDQQIADLEARLKLRETALRLQFAAADKAMKQLASQGGSLANLGSQFRLF